MYIYTYNIYKCIYNKYNKYIYNFRKEIKK